MAPAAIGGSTERSNPVITSPGAELVASVVLIVAVLVALALLIVPELMTFKYCQNDNLH